MVVISEFQIGGDKIQLTEYKISADSPVWQKITTLIESCMVPGLSKPYDEFTDSLDAFFQPYILDIESKLSELTSVLNALNNVKLAQSLNHEFVATLFVLIEEMKTLGPWHEQFYSSHSAPIIEWFKEKCDFSNRNKEYKEKVIYNSMRNIHKKLTKEKWKHHPATLQCYRNIINNLQEPKKLSIPLALMFPATLLQLDDYHIENKMEGLKCCSSLLRNLDFSKTGYEEVVYETLILLLKYKGAAVLEGVMDSIILILPTFSTDECNNQWSRCDDLFEIILGDMYLENDSLRKKTYFKYLPTLIENSGNSTFRWKKKLIRLLCDNLDIYLIGSLDLSILLDCLKCIKVWLTIGWPVWNPSADYEILIRLYKIVYFITTSPVTTATEECLSSVENCIISVFSLYSVEQRQKMLDDSSANFSSLGENFQTHWESLKNKVNSLPNESKIGKNDF